jgi:hypothetical protein
MGAILVCHKRTIDDKKSREPRGSFLERVGGVPVFWKYLWYIDDVYIFLTSLIFDNAENKPLFGGMNCQNSRILCRTVLVYQSPKLTHFNLVQQYFMQHKG